jgi:hypothetical protein
MRDTVSNNQPELSDKQWKDITKLIKVLSESLKTYIDDIKDPSLAPGKESLLIAMQVLSILCGMKRGYSKTDLDNLWSTSLGVSSKIHASKNTDKVEPGLQGTILPTMKSNTYKN